MTTTNKTQWFTGGQTLGTQHATGVYGTLACGHFTIVAETAGHSCKSEIMREDQIANAKLIARAPELQAIVEFLGEWLEAGANNISLSALFGEADDYSTTLADAVRDALT